MLGYGLLMISRVFGGTAGAMLLAAGLGMGLSRPAHAQPPLSLVPATLEPASAESSTPDHASASGEAQSDAGLANQPDTSNVDIDDLDWSQLNVDSSNLSYGAAAKATAAQRMIKGDNDTSWSGNGRPDGATAVSVKRSVSPFWDARVGADMTVAREPTTMAELVAEKAANGGALPQSAGSAWAAITAPGAGSIWDKTAIEARVDPALDQSKFGTSISKSVPLGDGYSMILQNGYSMTQRGGVPLPGAASPSARNYETDQSAKLSIEDTGTSITAGQALSLSDEKWLRKFGAEQKVMEGVSVSGSIGESPQGTISKSISAGFKKSW
jgi:hypothetical protein